MRRLYRKLLHDAFTIVIAGETTRMTIRVTRLLLVFFISITGLITVMGTYSMMTIDSARDKNLDLAVSMHDRLEMQSHLVRITEENKKLSGLIAVSSTDILNHYETVEGGERPYSSREFSGVTGKKLFDTLNDRFEESGRIRIFTSIPYGIPVTGTYGSGYGWRINPFGGGWHHHDGIDFFTHYGVPVYSTANGVVVHSGWGGGLYGGYGICVIIDTGFYLVIYGHMNGVHVNYGQKVYRGMLLGIVGSTGMSKGPHLHYEIRTGFFEPSDTNMYDLDCKPGEYCKNSFGK